MKAPYALVAAALLPLFAHASQADIDFAIAPVKSNAELQAVLSQSNSPLDALGSDETSFVDSVAFSSSGVASFDSSILEAESCRSM